MTREEPIRTVRDARRWSVGLTAAGSAERREMDWLLASILDVPLLELYTSPDRPLSSREASAFRNRWLRRNRGEPLQYLLGETEFMSLPFRIIPGVFISRPETECLVEAVIARCGDGGGLWIELGTGSGVIAVSLAVNMPRAELCATDISTTALHLARENARRHGVADRVQFIRGDLFDPFRKTSWADGIVSNPPYIPEDGIKDLPEEVRDHEPRAALCGGADGLDVIRALISGAPTVLKPGGLLAFEIGDTQAKEVRSILRSDPRWEGTAIEKDLTGRPRIAIATRSE